MAGPGDNFKKDDQYYPYSHGDLQVRLAYDANGNVEYVGYGLPGALDSDEKWQIEKFTYTSGKIVSGKYAGGSNIYDKEWDERASYSYS